MYMQVLAYYTLDSLLTVEVSVSETGPDGAPQPLHFVGRTHEPAKAPLGVLAGPEMIFAVAEALRSISMGLTD
jgi:hypothetical protein